MTAHSAKSHSKMSSEQNKENSNPAAGEKKKAQKKGVIMLKCAEVSF